jgi:arginyl-tRNA synthetase
MYAKQQKMSPLALAVQLVEQLKSQAIPGIEKIEVAGPGFINFYLTAKAINNALADISTNQNYGKSELEKGKKIVYEYTDPNPFKVFHIGHLMANTVGESLSRLGEFAGADVQRYCYPGDIGRHVALTIWGFRFMDESMPEDTVSLSEKVTFLGKAYATGAQKFYEAEKAAEEKADDSVEKIEFKKFELEVQTINKKLYDQSDEELNKIYAQGREWSLEHFEEIYALLGTSFDRYFFESQATKPGLEIVRANTAPNGLGIFEESDGAIIFPGEKYDLHTRVFITRFGLPAYEAKEIGLARLKYDAYPYDKGVTVTANEQNDYFKVVLKATQLLFPEIGTKATHISHGMLRLTSGKMSSRTGNAISGESLLNEMNEMALLKMVERDMSLEDKHTVSKQVGVAAIKYTVLRQAIGKDIIFDPEKSLSFEGDSGPYLQYSVVRANSVLEKGKKENVTPSLVAPSVESDKLKAGTLDWAGGTLERLLVRFPEVAAYAYSENAPHHIATYLMELASTFNSFYASTQIIVKDDVGSAYRLGLVEAFTKVMNKGLWLLGIQVPAKM